MKTLKLKIADYKRIEKLMSEAVCQMNAFIGIDEDLFWQFENEAEKHSETLKKMFSEMQSENNMSINEVMNALN